MHFDLDRSLKETCERMKALIEASGDTEYMKLVDLSQMYVIHLKGFFIKLEKRKCFHFQTVI